MFEEPVSLFDRCLRSHLGQHADKEKEKEKLRQKPARPKRLFVQDLNIPHQSEQCEYDS
jgi:hypothetical protein